MSSLQHYDAAIQFYCQAIRSVAPYCTNLVIAAQNSSQNQNQNQDNLETSTHHQANVEFNSEPIDPSMQADVLVNLGAVFWYAQRFQSALEATQEAVRLNPQSFGGWYNQGIFLAALGRYDEALTAYDQAGRLSPNSICRLADTLRIQVPNPEQTHPSNACVLPGENSPSTLD